MNNLAVLVSHSLRRRRGFLAAVAVVLVIFQFFMILTARNFEETGGFRQIAALMPSFLAQWTNMAAASFTGFVLFGYSHPIVQLFLMATAINIGTEPVAEIETRFVDLLMARPLSRVVPIARTVVVLALAAVLAVGTMYVATRVGLAWLAPAGARLPQPRTIASLSINLVLLVVAWGAIALAIGSFATRRAAAATVCGFFAFTTFVLDYVGKFWAAVKPWSRISPFHYFDPFAMIGGRSLQSADVVALAAMFVVSVAVAGVVYARRDL